MLRAPVLVCLFVFKKKFGCLYLAIFLAFYSYLHIYAGMNFVFMFVL